jgi:hypothetical protein
MTREVARRLIFLLWRGRSTAAIVGVAGIAVASACYPGGGGGSNPPTNTFYFPVGLAVSAGGNALYVVNSDFDLQYNGGTLQSYDLFAIRGDAAALIQNNLAGRAPDVLSTRIPFVFAAPSTPCAIGQALPGDAGAPTLNASDGSRIQLGQGCAPPIDTSKYQKSSAVIGAFATDLQIQTSQQLTSHGNLVQVVGTRLFAPVRGDATLTWADVGPDSATGAPADDIAESPDAADPALSSDRPGRQGLTPVGESIFTLGCGQPLNGPCDAAHRTGNFVDSADSRAVTMPGEPFGMAQTPDGTAIAITHQTETQTSLLLSGSVPMPQPSMQFVVDGVDNGGKGITAVPHDPDGPVPPCELLPTGSTAACVRPAFLETSGSAAELDLLRYYDDDGTMSSLKRPFLAEEAIFPFSTNLAGTDSRGIVMDPTLRMQCKLTGAATPQQCAELPARVFFANRTPSTLVLASIGGTSTTSPSGYDPDLLTFSTGNLPLPAGPSRVYIAPISNLEHKYELRVFVVNFDSSTISVFDPKNGPDLALIDTIYVGPGPFAMAFDPFSIEDVAGQHEVPKDARYNPALGLDRGYRFAYVASFTQSYVQVIDLDETQPTFESVVYTLGKPTPPKGSGSSSGQ